LWELSCIYPEISGVEPIIASTDIEYKRITRPTEWKSDPDVPQITPEPLALEFFIRHLSTDVISRS
jgi:hypothetical protein